MSLRSYIAEFTSRQHVRPWALAGPVLVLVIALPMLRPLRVQDPALISGNELSRLATVQALVEMRTQAIEHTTFFPALLSRCPKDLSGPLPNMVHVDNSYYSDKPPVMAMLLAGPYWLLWHYGVTFRDNPVVVAYVLTLLGITLPVAASAGLIYRMGRLFELPRRWRTGLGIAVVTASGLLSYSVVINSHAPAAALVLGACGCLIHVAAAGKPARTGAWLMTAGFCGALATVLDLGAGFIFAGLVLVILVMRWPPTLRLGGVLAYVVGAVPPLLLHAVLNMAVTGGVVPVYLQRPGGALGSTQAPDPRIDAWDDESPPEKSWGHRAWESAGTLAGAFVGSRGMLSHFPVEVFGMAGLALVLRRHWPRTTKALACVTGAGVLLAVLSYAYLGADWTQPMFGPRWFIVFLPLLMFWSGAWLRKAHHPAIWACAGILLAVSMTVTVIGMTNPFVAAGPSQYTPVAALRQLLNAGPRASR